MSEHLDWWMDRYLEAWDSNDPAHIAALFTEDAVYDPQTADGPWQGVREIVEAWIAIDDTPGNWEFEWTPLVETDDVAVITGHTRYLDPPASYRNLWVILWDPDKGLCRDFTEWWIDEE